METIKYKSEETNRVFEYKEKEWYYKTSEGETKLIPSAAFYEEGSDDELLRKFKSKRIQATTLLLHGDDPHNVLCETGYLYLPIKGKIMKTKQLTRT